MQKKRQTRPRRARYAGAYCVVWSSMAWYGRDGMAVAVEHPSTVVYSTARCSHAGTQVSSTLDFAHKSATSGPLLPDWTIHRP